jgi:hypothetical protein
MKVFLICPVRNVDEQTTTRIDAYVKSLEDRGVDVYWPARDTDQNDQIGFRICNDNYEAISSADEIHIWWNKDSKGSLFDLGMAWALEKELVVANQEEVTPTVGKSFQNVLLEWSVGGRGDWTD